MQKLPTFFQQNISICAIFDDQNFNDTLTNDIVSFEQLGPVLQALGSIFFPSEQSPFKKREKKKTI